MPQIVPAKQAEQNIATLLEKMKPEIAKVAPKHLTPDRIARIFMSSIRRTPKLAQCSMESLFGSLMSCTQLGLEPDGVAGMAYLIPYGTTCQLIVGYKGLMALARRSPDVAMIDVPRVVYEKDKYDFDQGLHPTLTHRPSQQADRGEMIAVYAVAELSNGKRLYEWMWKCDVDKIRDKSRAGKDGPWVTDYEAMALKTVLRRLCKWLPSSSELQTAVSMDEMAEAGINQPHPTVDIEITSPSEPAPEPQSELDKIVADKASEAPPKQRSKTKRVKVPKDETVEPAAPEAPSVESNDYAVVVGQRADLQDHIEKMDPRCKNDFMRKHNLVDLEHVDENTPKDEAQTEPLPAEGVETAGSDFAQLEARRTRIRERFGKLDFGQQTGWLKASGLSRIESIENIVDLNQLNDLGIALLGRGCVA